MNAIIERSGGHEGLFACRTVPLVYATIPKSACTTIKNLLYRIDNGSDYPNPLAIHSDSEALLRSVSSDKAGYQRAVEDRRVCFTFVRDPCQRAYSAFNEKVFFTGPYSFQKMRQAIAQDYGARFPGLEESYSADQHSANFAAFLRFAMANITERTGFTPNPHWHRQSALVDAYEARLSVDCIGQVETLAADLGTILAEAGVRRDVDLSIRLNQGPAPPYALEAVLSEECRTLLLDIYERDFDRFQYSPPFSGHPPCRSDAPPWNRPVLESHPDRQIVRGSEMEIIDQGEAFVSSRTPTERRSSSDASDEGQAARHAGSEEIGSMRDRWQHVFIITYGRSGSTLLMNLLNASDEILIFGENSNYLYNLFRTLRDLKRWRDNAPQRGLDSPAHAFFGASYFDFEQAQTKLIEEARSLFSRYAISQRKVVGFKEVGYLTPDLVEYLDFLTDTFERTFLIFLTREPANVAQSGFFRHYSEARAVSAVRGANRSFSDYAAMHPDRSLLLDYEDLVGKRPPLFELLRRLGATLTEAQLDTTLVEPVGHNRRSLRALEPGVNLLLDHASLRDGRILFDYFNVPDRAPLIDELRPEGIVLSFEGDQVRRVFCTSPSGRISEAAIGLPSPRFAEKYPALEHSGRSRFLFRENILSDGSGSYVLSAEFHRRGIQRLGQLTILLALPKALRV